MKKIVVCSFACLFVSMISCGGGGGGLESTVTQFMDNAKAQKIDAALKLVENKYDQNVPVKIKDYFSSKTIESYTVIPDKDPKANTAQKMGMGIAYVEIQFSTGKEKVKFVMKKSEDSGKWVISNIIL